MNLVERLGGEKIERGGDSIRRILIQGNQYHTEQFEIHNVYATRCT